MKERELPGGAKHMLSLFYYLKHSIFHEYQNITCFKYEGILFIHLTLGTV